MRNRGPGDSEVKFMISEEVQTARQAVQDLLERVEEQCKKAQTIAREALD